MAKRFFPSDEIQVKNNRVVITLDEEGAEWLHSCLPGRDGFTEHLWSAIECLNTSGNGSSREDA